MLELPAVFLILLVLTKLSFCVFFVTTPLDSLENGTKT